MTFKWLTPEIIPPQLERTDKFRIDRYFPKFDRPMSVAVIGSRGIPSNYSGVEKICESLFTYFASCGHKVTVYCRPNVLSEPRAVYKGVRLVRTPAPGGRNLETLSHTAASVVHALTHGDVHDGGKKFDAISLHAIAPNLFAPLIRGAGLACISHVHGLDWAREKWRGTASRVLRTAERLMVRYASHIVVVSRDLQNYYRTQYGLETSLIPNGIHHCSDVFDVHRPILDKFGLTPHEYIVTVCRLVPEKRIHDIIAAFRLTSSRQKLVIIGAGIHSCDYEQRLKAQAAGDDRIVFTGHQGGEALETLFRCSSLYVSASELEGLPMSLLECMEHRIPCVLSDIPPHRELMAGASGYDLFFRPGDVDTLRKHLTRALQEPERSSQFADLSREFVRRHYSWPSLAQNTERQYRQVLAEHLAFR
jgi:glycosyltransferase involved in cell wall biosynthesis